MVTAVAHASEVAVSVALAGDGFVDAAHAGN